MNYDLEILSTRQEKRLTEEEAKRYWKPIFDFIKRKNMDLLFNERSDNANLIKFTLKPTKENTQLDSYFKDLDTLYSTYKKMEKEKYYDKITLTIPKDSEDRQILSLKRILESEDYFDYLKSKEATNNLEADFERQSLNFVLGETVENEMIIKDLRECIHLLIAGETGSGKSQLIHTIITSLMYLYSPKTLKFVIIDMKAILEAFYVDSPYLYAPNSSNIEDALKTLDSLVLEMEKRFQLIRSFKCVDIDEYNSLQKDNKLPFIVVVIDEYADLIFTSKDKETEGKIRSLAQKARACGIHLIISTQRPIVDVVSSLIKNNLPTKIALSVSDAVGSRVILDEGGAESLTGRGDMIFKSAREKIRLQGAYISSKEVSSVVDETIQKYGTNKFNVKKVRKQQDEIVSEVLIRKLEEGDMADNKIVVADDLIYTSMHMINLGYASRVRVKRFLSCGDNKADKQLAKMVKYKIIDEYDKERLQYPILMNLETLENKFISVSEANGS